MLNGAEEDGRGPWLVWLAAVKSHVNNDVVSCASVARNVLQFFCAIICRLSNVTEENIREAKMLQP